GGDASKVVITLHHFGRVFNRGHCLEMRWLDASRGPAFVMHWNMARYLLTKGEHVYHPVREVRPHETLTQVGVAAAERVPGPLAASSATGLGCVMPEPFYGRHSIGASISEGRQLEALPILLPMPLAQPFGMRRLVAVGALACFPLVDP